MGVMCSIIMDNNSLDISSELNKPIAAFTLLAKVSASASWYISHTKRAFDRLKLSHELRVPQTDSIRCQLMKIE